MRKIDSKVLRQKDETVWDTFFKSKIRSFMNLCLIRNEKEIEVGNEIYYCFGDDDFCVRGHGASYISSRYL